MRATRVILLASLCACASTAPPENAARTAPAATTSAGAEGSAAPLSRTLGPGASYGDLIRVARVLLRAHGADSEAGCLLRREREGFTLAADLAPALDELPSPPVELDSRLQRDLGTVHALTPFGAVGAADGSLGLASFTMLSPRALRAPVLALVLTNEGVYLRRGDRPSSEQDGPLTPSAAVARAFAEAEAADASVLLSAEAAVPIDAVAALLRMLPAGSTAALSVVLPEGTRWPDAPAPSTASRCPDGLPVPAADRAEGELDPSAIVSALAPLRAAAERCVSGARGKALLGGRLVLALRIAEDGRPEQTCLFEDAIGDAGLATCVLASAREIRFPAPRPSGFVDVHLPLALELQNAPAPKPLCE